MTEAQRQRQREDRIMLWVLICTFGPLITAAIYLLIRDAGLL